MWKKIIEKMYEVRQMGLEWIVIVDLPACLWGAVNWSCSGYQEWRRELALNKIDVLSSEEKFLSFFDCLDYGNKTAFLN